MTMTSPTNYQVLPTMTAAQFSNGNSSGGNNASPNGGIVRIYGQSGVTNNANLQSVPQAMISGADQSPTGTFGPLGYWEGYVQYNANLGGEHVSFWTLPIDWANTTELDIMEEGANFGSKNWWLGNLNQWSGGSDIATQSSNNTIPSDAQWHTMGILVKATTGGQGTVSVYLDNVLKGTVTVGTGTPYPNALTTKRAWLLGKDFIAGNGNSINFDWVRYWGPGTSPTPTPTPSPTPSESPYTGTRASIPGTIEAENYDLGGEGIAYHDADTINTLGAYRTDGVDIKTCTDTTGCGFAVGTIAGGEWMNYMVNVTTAGSYTFSARVATPTQAKASTSK
jgi:hypothetical protein